MKNYLVIFLLAFVWPVQLWAQEPYAVLSDNNTVLTFYFDNQKETRGGMDVGPFYSWAESEWWISREAIKNVVFDTSFANCASITSTAYWFHNCINLTTITGIENLNTAKVTSMEDMFYGCSSLTSLDVSNFNTANVTSMKETFFSCHGLTSLDVSNFNTSNVTDMSGMFGGCSSLTSLDLSNFKTDNVISMTHMFLGCSSLTNLNLSNFNTAKVKGMDGMFENCSSLTSLDLSNFNTANVRGMQNMFGGCSALTSLDVSNFNTTNVTGMSSMFSGCSSLTSLDVSNFNTANVTAMAYMFSGCYHLVSLDLRHFNTSKVTSMYTMFADCSALTTIYASDTWSTAKLILNGKRNIFTRCRQLVGGNGTKYDANHTDDTYARIDKHGEPGYFTDGNTFSVVGAFNSTEESLDDILFGAFWDTTIDDNVMSLDSETDLYVWTKKGVELSEGTIYYKIVKNHSWNENWGIGGQNGDNAEYVVTEPGDYDITIYFHPEKTFDDGNHLRCVLLPSGDYEFDYGKYVFYNIEAQKYWGTGNDWDTQATLVEHPVYQMLIATPEGKYRMETQVDNNYASYWFSGDYMDSGKDDAVLLTVTPTAEPIGYKDDAKTQPVYAYTIADGNNCFGNNTKSTVLGKNLPADSKDALWMIIPLEEAKATIANATIDNPSDATIFIEDYNFNRNNRCANYWKNSDGTSYAMNYGNRDCNAEAYMTTFECYQELHGLPNGLYKLDAQAAVTFHDNRVKKEYDGNRYPVVFAGETTSNFVDMIPTDQLSNQDQMATQFKAGIYKIDPIFIEVTDGTLIIGAKSNRSDIWAVWDNFVLTYYGSDANIDQVKNNNILGELKKLREQTAQLLASGEIAITTVVEALQMAYEESSEVSGEEAINNAIEILKEAIDRGEASIIAKNVLPMMKELTETTNVYTDEAYNEYYEQWNQKYEAGTLTKAEANVLQNPFAITAWHASVNVDNFLLSVWDTNPDFYEAAYYVNTWSTEGVEGYSDYSGIEFGVPFFEYWGNNETSLDERTLTATINHLTAGWYEVKALVRVRVKDGNTDAPYGVMLQVNNGNMIDVTAGNQIGDSQFFIEQFTAKGEVGDDGVLKIKFIVSEYNNINWLAYKNLKFLITAETEPQKVEVPMFSLDNNTLTITAQTDATIYFTTDETTPTKNSSLYTGSISLTRNCLVKAVAIKDGIESRVATLFVDWFNIGEVTYNYKDHKLSFNCNNPNAHIYYTINSVDVDHDAWYFNNSFSNSYEAWYGTGEHKGMAEVYEETVNTTGVILTQNVGLPNNGVYEVELYANAYFTPGKGIVSDVVEGTTDVAYVFANDVKEFIPCHIGTSIGETPLYTLKANVINGVLRIGLAKNKAGTNWHTIQIKTLKYLGSNAFTSAIMYTEPLQIAGNCIVKAVATDGYKYSETVTFTENSLRVADVTYKFENKQLTLSSSTSGVAIIYTLNGSDVVPPIDYTPLVSTESQKWTGSFNDFDGYASTWAAPAITTFDGRSDNMVERYVENVNEIGVQLEQTVTGLENGIYDVVLFANAYFTNGRGFDSDMVEGATDVAYVFANSSIIRMPGHIGLNVSSNEIYRFRIEVTDGTLHIGLGKDKEGTNWHTIQICSLKKMAEYNYEYIEPLVITEKCTVKAVATKAYQESSNVTSFEFDPDNYKTKMPIFSVDENNHTLSIFTETEGAVLYFTTDGSEPTISSMLYENPIVINGNSIVKAIAITDNLFDSDVATYEVDWFKVADIAIMPNGTTVEMSTATEGAAIHYTIDGSTPTATSTVYNVPLSFDHDVTIKAIGVKANFNDSEVTTFEYHRADYTTAIPVIAFNAADSTVTMSCATEDAIIHYTLDGTDPTEASPTYTVKVKPGRNCTVKAFAIAEGYFSSGMSERLINSFKVQPVTFSLSGLSLTLATDTKDATIRYSIDGSESQTVYNGIPITLGDAVLTVRAYASRDDWTDSDITTYSYDPDKHTVEPPVFIRNGHELTITTVVEGATIYYTMDGSTPTETSNRYNTPITLTQNCTVKAFATAEGMLPSSVVSYDVTDFKAEDVTFTVSNLLLMMETVTEDALIRYTTDGTPPTEDTGLEYREPLPLSSLADGSTVYAIATKENFNPSDVTWFVYHRSDYTVATPTFEENGNELTISTTTEGASIYYTTDGTDPTTGSTLYTVPIPLIGNMTVKAIAVLEGLFNSEIVSYIVGGFQVEIPVMALDHATGRLTITCNTEESTIHYIIGNGTEQAYSEPVIINLTDNSIVRAWATADNFNKSEEVSITPVKNGVMDGETFRISGEVTGDELLFLRNIMGQQMEHLDMENATLSSGGLADEAFAGMGILTATLPKSIATVGERLFSGCRRLAAVVWRAGTRPAPTATTFEGIGNPNLLLYVDSEEAGKSSGVANLIVNQMAREITLSDPVVSEAPVVPEGPSVSDCNFYCPIPFTANRISYSHVYKQQSGMGGKCQGWETIALPFTVKDISHRVKGTIAPFGSQESQIPENAPRFWLYMLGSTLFEGATTIAANMPYIISMPEHPDFAPQYCLGNDTITFSATNAEVPVTNPQTATFYGTSTLHANFTTQAASSNLYVMNIGEKYDDDHLEGSIFVRELRAARPFEAYITTTVGGARYIELFGDDADSIMNVENGRWPNFNGYSSMVNAYDLSGRRTTDGGRRILPHKRLVIKNGKVRTAK